MRDGIKLFTVVFSPSNETNPLPVLILRTPYGADKPDNYNPVNVRFISNIAKEGYKFVFQDIRGKNKSEGVFEEIKPLYHLTDKIKTEESTDAYDAIDWLIKNIPNNNGKIGIYGISYPGFTALNAISDPHPTLKASSPQAAPADMFLADDIHHNGAFRLSYGYEISYRMGNNKGSNSSFPFPQFDLYDWYLKLGSLKNVNVSYFKNQFPMWNDFAQHPNYDSYWKSKSALLNIKYLTIHVLHVCGYYDQENLNGPQHMYSKLEKVDSFTKNLYTNIRVCVRKMAFNMNCVKSQVFQVEIVAKSCFSSWNGVRTPSPARIKPVTNKLNLAESAP